MVVLYEKVEVHMYPRAQSAQKLLFGEVIWWAVGAVVEGAGVSSALGSMILVRVFRPGQVSLLHHSGLGELVADSMSDSR